MQLGNARIFTTYQDASIQVEALISAGVKKAILPEAAAKAESGHRAQGTGHRAQGTGPEPDSEASDDSHGGGH